MIATPKKGACVAAAGGAAEDERSWCTSTLGDVLVPHASAEYLAAALFDTLLKLDVCAGFVGTE